MVIVLMNVLTGRVRYHQSLWVNSPLGRSTSTGDIDSKQLLGNALNNTLSMWDDISKSERDICETRHDYWRLRDWITYQQHSPCKNDTCELRYWLESLLLVGVLRERETRELRSTPWSLLQTLPEVTQRLRLPLLWDNGRKLETCLGSLATECISPGPLVI